MNAAHAKYRAKAVPRYTSYPTVPQYEVLIFVRSGVPITFKQSEDGFTSSSLIKVRRGARPRRDFAGNGGRQGHAGRPAIGLS